ncbi:hypothetical protein CAPTEDRAFT_186605 [Capitella teleta]|uniref:Uncharacterized protein n=1 Tax=Capitella teleta TaxID=283909 RepID=R7TA01_CAPTE|nr:hypothetical protein CAPTEDRAFT_186605 [Capitella teleta]|eukprot:ELT90544.1 hypothetical protein CAPTEDRAFT_186605 [Capitella teleta]
MGALASVLRRGDDDDELGVEYDTSQGVVKRIPIEVKPRGKLGLRTGRSVGKPKGSSSLRSALSFELENPEVEKIRKDFEMYRLNKENEIGNMQKIVRKLETENKKLRAELQTIQKTCQKLREERDSALDAEHQALVRAMTFEGDRDKIQRQFKIFRETKESELRNLLKTRRDLESKLSRVGLEDSSDPTSRLKATMSEYSCSGNPGDWWTALESEPSLGSTTQLHTMVSRGPEFAHTLHEMDGPYINVNKGNDWQVAAASLAQVFPGIPESLQSNLIQVFISAPSDVQDEVNIILKVISTPFIFHADLLNYFPIGTCN